MSLILDGTNGLSDVDGSASTPAIRGTDTNTGIFFPAADTIAFTEGGAEAMRINSSGNVGIGTSSPVEKLRVLGTNAALLSNQTSSYAPSVNASSNSLVLVNESPTTGSYNSLEFWSRNDSSNINIAYIASPSTSTNNSGTLAFGRRTASGTSAESMRIDSSGNVGIGTSSPASLLDVRNGTGSVVTLGNTGSFVGGESSYIKWQEGSTQLADIGWAADTNEVRINNRIAGPTTFYTSNTERMRIDSSGNLVMASRSGGGNTAQLQVGTTSILGTSVNSYGQFGGDSGTPYPLGVKGNSSSQGMVGFFDSANSVIGSVSKSGSNVAYNTSSDYRLKENITPMMGALDKVSALKPVTYTWKADGSNGQGFIAHELAEVCPDAVTGEKDAVETYTDEDGNEQTRIKPQGIDTSFLVATLTAAIKEQQAIITDLKARIETLEAK